MAFEKSLFLNSLICLKAEPPKRTQENSVVTNSLPGSNQQSLTLITGKGKPAPHLNRLSRLLSLLLRAYLSFLKSFVFQKVFFSPSSSPIKAVHKPEILTISLCYICVCVWTHMCIGLRWIKTCLFSCWICLLSVWFVCSQRLRWKISFSFLTVWPGGWNVGTFNLLQIQKPQDLWWSWKG